MVAERHIVDFIILSAQYYLVSFFGTGRGRSKALFSHICSHSCFTHFRVNPIPVCPSLQA